MRTIIYGPPGTGKTHTLLQHIEKFLETTDSDKIGYFTFSKNAAQEGRERAVSQTEEKTIVREHLGSIYAIADGENELISSGLLN